MTGYLEKKEKERKSRLIFICYNWIEKRLKACKSKWGDQLSLGFKIMII